MVAQYKGAGKFVKGMQRATSGVIRSIDWLFGLKV